jgi:hypothetical protein
MPGPGEQIVVTGTSSDGGLSAIVAANGNDPDCFDYLSEIGAAGIRKRTRAHLPRKSLSGPMRPVAAHA